MCLFDNELNAAETTSGWGRHWSCEWPHSTRRRRPQGVYDSRLWKEAWHGTSRN